MTEPTIEEMQELMRPTEAETIIDGEVEEIGTDLEVRDREPHPMTLFHTDDPDEVLARAAKTADSLARVIKDRGLATNISGRDHVRVEGWTLLGSMLGVFAVCTETIKLEDGWKARVEARTIAGDIVGAAEAECLRSEKEWGPTPSRGRPKDDYALLSMAQTRATSKALRQPLGFVMTLAGFDPTPTEEMPAETAGGHTAPPAATERAATSGQMQELGLTVKLLQDAYPEAADAGKTWKQTAWRHGGEFLGFSPSGELTAKQANDLREWLEEQFKQLELADQVPSKAAAEFAATPAEIEESQAIADDTFRAPE